MAHQELHDLAAVAEFFAGDALCFATVSCLAAHLPYSLRALALDRARKAISKLGLPVSEIIASTKSDGYTETPINCSSETANAGGGSGSATPERDPEGGTTTPRISVRRPRGIPSTPATSTTSLTLDRFRLGHFAPGVLTNLAQLQGWAYVPGSSAPEGNADDSGDDSDSYGGTGATSGGESAHGKNGACLPFHPAFMDAAVLTLSTPKWPVILDPEGVALR